MVVIVSGMIAATPRQGGAAWAVLQYLLGLRRLGCDVHFVEPIAGDYVPPTSVSYCTEVMERFGLDDRWALVPSDAVEPVGMSRERLRRLARRADVLLNVSGMLPDPDVFEQVPMRAFLDLDPAFTQLWHAVEGVDMRLDAHTHFVTVADAIGQRGLPDSGLRPSLAAHAAAGRARGVAGRNPPRAPRTHHRRPLAQLWLDPPRGRPVRSEGALAAAADRPATVERRSLSSWRLRSTPTRQDDLAALEANGWRLLDPNDGRGDA